MNVRRSQGVYITFERRLLQDPWALVAGNPKTEAQDHMIAMAASSQREIRLNATDLQLLAAADSVRFETAQGLADRCGTHIRFVEQLVRCGLLETGDDAPGSADAQALWHADSLYYHRRGRWRGRGEAIEAPSDPETAADWLAGSEERFTDLSGERGTPPQALYSHPTSEQTIQLSKTEHSSPLSDLLHRRKTVRLFDTDTTLTEPQFARIMAAVFGVRGYVRVSPDLLVLKKASPSAGSLHPVEVFPLVIGVDGIPCGMYHYHAGEQSLEPVAGYTQEEARELAAQLSAGQAWFSSAQVVLFYTARYERNLWKYRNHPKAYRAVMMDAAHLSQNLYLMCAEEGLGAFYTAACNDADIDEVLGLDGIGHGALAIGGFGVPAPGGGVMAMSPKPYSPGQNLT